jgi:hypothetical protein
VSHAIACSERLVVCTSRTNERIKPGTYRISADIKKIAQPSKERNPEA